MRGVVLAVAVEKEVADAAAAVAVMVGPMGAEGGEVACRTAPDHDVVGRKANEATLAIP